MLRQAHVAPHGSPVQDASGDRRTLALRSAVPPRAGRLAAVEPETWLGSWIGPAGTDGQPEQQQDRDQSKPHMEQNAVGRSDVPYTRSNSGDGL